MESEIQLLTTLVCFYSQKPDTLEYARNVIFNLFRLAIYLHKKTHKNVSTGNGSLSICDSPKISRPIKFTKIAILEPPFIIGIL